MTKRILGAFLGLLALAACSLHAQTTAITYQGRLFDNGVLPNGNYDLRFVLKDASAGGSTVGTPLTNAPVIVSNGLFTVTLDFGSGAFTGAGRWLEIGVRTNGSTASHTVLAPRQPMTSAPYAVQALSAGTSASAVTLSGTVPSGGLSGSYSGAVAFNNAANSFTGNGGGLMYVNAATLDGLNASSFWKLGGNSGANPTNGAFIGTVDNQALELWVNNNRALRLEPTTDDFYHYGIVNVLGGSPANYIAPGVYGGTICGGGAVNYFGLDALLKNRDL